MDTASLISKVNITSVVTMATTCNPLSLTSSMTLTSDPLEADEIFDRVSTDTAEQVDFYLNCVVSNTFAMIGVVSNVLNLLVLGAQGLKDSVNITLFSLSLSDLAYETTTFILHYYCFFFKEDIFRANNARTEIVPQGTMLRIGCARLSHALTALIAVERCACVLLPLRFKRIATGRCAFASVLCIYVAISVMWVPILFLYRIVKVPVPELNMTRSIIVLTDFHIENYTAMRFFADMAISVILPLLNLFVVCLCSLMIIFRLKISSKWRKSLPGTSSSAADGTRKVSEESASSKRPPRAQTSSSADEKARKLTMMLVTISCIYIVCLLPGTVGTVMRLIFPEFTLNRKFHKTYVVVYYVDFTLQTFNSAVNFFVYMVMSSKFREVFLAMVTLPCLVRRKMSSRALVATTGPLTPRIAETPTVSCAATVTRTGD